MSEDRRSIEREVELDATPAEVWKALTDADELTRWFPLHSEVKPGVNGFVRLHWDDVWDGHCPIEIWEPNRHLRTRWFEKAQPFETAAAPETPIAVDYFIESRTGGGAMLRVVTSGFSNDESWDDLYDSMKRGWTYELRSLQRYLQHHKGEDRTVAWSRRRIEVSMEDAWRRLTGPDFLNLPGAAGGAAEGTPLAFSDALGDRYEGKLEVMSPPRDFAMLAASHNNGMLRLHLDQWTHDGGRPFVEVFLWLAMYGVDASVAAAVERRWNDRMKKVFPEASITVGA